jgi:protein phosphatase
MVSDSRITDVLSRISDPDRACAELVELALEAGGKDNVTIIVANYSLPGDSHAG